MSWWHSASLSACWPSKSGRRLTWIRSCRAKLSGSPNDLANKVEKIFFFNKPFNLFKYSMHIPHFIWNNERQGERDRDREEGSGRVRESSWRKEEEKESERTKCNLSAYSDSQCLKWELTENVEDCSLIGQGHSWHFQAKLQRRWWERICYNYKLFSLCCWADSFFLFFYHICIIFYRYCSVLYHKADKTANPHSKMNRRTHTYMNHGYSLFNLGIWP